MSARDPLFAAGLREAVRGTVRERELLERYSTYRIGGPATVLLPAGPEDVVVALRFAEQAGVSVFVLGLGSNVLLPDDGLDALVLRLGKGLDAVSQNGSLWSFGAGLPAPLAARRTAEAGWSGLHVMVGVPGTVGGGVFMNAGCHGGEWRQVTTRVMIVDRSGVDRWVPATAIPFTYRQSGLDGVVVEVEVELAPGDPGVLADRVRDLYAWRQRETPFNQPCCGSVFRNPDLGSPLADTERPRTAGQLIEAVGLKGYVLGGAQVSQMHANYFVNTGSATAADVDALMLLVHGRVRERFGVTLLPEVKRIAPNGTTHPQDVFSS